MGNVSPLEVECHAVDCHFVDCGGVRGHLPDPVDLGVEYAGIRGGVWILAMAGCVGGAVPAGAWPMKRFFIGWGLLLTLVGAGMAACSDNSTSSQEYVFICEDDGGPVEQHVGVAESYPSSVGGGLWYIRYMDGHQAYYRQPEGETCFTEVVAMKTY